jgi:hypothetical protein
MPRNDGDEGAFGVISLHGAVVEDFAIANSSTEHAEG